ncbi:hypothetical protein INT45_011176 [Circinella minor]|uniref:N-acetyltransferase domain-containing protein n=1 Tax=Circinella minor TaxID=1195481 RepID=A0A8H7RRG6_9FUNG|nr:hypothetical protein INT45_011176 [Circinella minor]
MVIPKYTNLEIHPALTEEDKQKCIDIRIKVFVHEQNYPLKSEIDQYDALSQYWLATCESIDAKERVAVGTVRLYKVNAQVGKVGRMAVLSDIRGMSVGSKLICTLREAAKAQGVQSLLLEGQVDKRTFYEKVGFVVEKEDEVPYDVRADTNERVPVGTIRSVPVKNDKQVGRLGRLAVLSDARGLSVGKKLALTMLEGAKTQGIKSIVLDGQVDKRGFYEKVGFVVEDADNEPFIYYDKPHYQMWMRSIPKEKLI